MTFDRAKPNPGSKEAREQGCLCPVLDNNHGKGITEGYGGTPENPAFWINGDCPIHGTKAKEEKLNG